MSIAVEALSRNGIALRRQQLDIYRRKPTHLAYPALCRLARLRLLTAWPKRIGFRNLGLIHGGVKDEDRVDIRDRFKLPKSDPEALDVLLMSEVGSEGLDFQFCDCMINYDLPWNGCNLSGARDWPSLRGAGRRG